MVLAEGDAESHETVFIFLSCMSAKEGFFFLPLVFFEFLYQFYGFQHSCVGWDLVSF